ncbi:MAG: hypothetical protein JWP83_2457 [Mycobacterium sp.]|jgi:hypothetical protein|nr:hypothetical protein [Mycobacterium sp.]
MPVVVGPYQTKYCDEVRDIVILVVPRQYQSPLRAVLPGKFTYDVPQGRVAVVRHLRNQHVFNSFYGMVPYVGGVAVAAEGVRPSLP